MLLKLYVHQFFSPLLLLTTFMLTFLTSPLTPLLMDPLLLLFSSPFCAVPSPTLDTTFLSPLLTATLSLPSSSMLTSSSFSSHSDSWPLSPLYIVWHENGEDWKGFVWISPNDSRMRRIVPGCSGMIRFCSNLIDQFTIGIDPECSGLFDALRSETLSYINKHVQLILDSVFMSHTCIYCRKCRSLMECLDIIVHPQTHS